MANHHGTLLKAGSVGDHVHLLLAHPRTCAPADLVKEIKAGSARWLKTRADTDAGFQWQAGYGMFSISPSRRPAVEAYLAEQAEHHRRISLQDEFRGLLRKYGVTFDEKFVWD